MSISGSYGITIHSPFGGREAILTLEVVGQNLNGVLVSEGASEAFSGGEVAGSSLSWEMDLTRPMPVHLVCSANIIGSSIKGTIQLGGFGNANFSGARI